jgi:hypothetical protein
VLPGAQLQKGLHMVEGREDVPPFFDTFEEFNEFCIQHRSRLASIVKLTAGLLPEQVCIRQSPSHHY